MGALRSHEDKLTQATQTLPLDTLRHDQNGLSQDRKAMDDEQGISSPETSEPPALAASYPAGWKLYIILVALLLGTLLVAIDNTIIAVVIPKVTTTFKALNSVGWYGSTYLMTVTAFQPTFGNLYKLFHTLRFKAKMRRLDVGGAILLIAAVCCLLLALQWGGVTFSWKSSVIIGLFVGSSLLSLAFAILQWRLGEEATTPLRILRQRSIYMGSAYVAFTNMAIFTLLLTQNSAVSISLGQTILLSRLSHEVPRLTKAISAQEVFHAGAVGLSSLSSDPKIIYSIRVAYASSISDVIIFTAAALAVAFPFALGMEWKNLKTHTEQ
ncbi:MAG: hypothetical protein Q9167_006225 [Letrouitia subvulpina]